MKTSFDIEDTKDILNVLSHEIVHDDHWDGLHVLNVHSEHSVETSQQRKWVLLQVSVVLRKYSLSHKQVQFLFLQSLNDELVISSVEEEAVWLARTNLESSHLDVISLWRERPKQSSNEIDDYSYLIMN